MNEGGPLGPAEMAGGIGEIAERRTGVAADGGGDEIGIVVGEIKFAVEFVEGIGEQAVVAIFLDAADFETEFEGMAAGDVGEDVVGGESVENEMAGLEDFSAHVNGAIVEEESAEVFEGEAGGFESLRGDGVGIHAEFEIAVVAGIGEAEIVESRGGKFVSVAEAEIGEEAGLRGSEAADICAGQFFASDIAVGGSGDPAAVELIAGAEALVDANGVLISVIGLELRGCAGALIGDIGIGRADGERAVDDRGHAAGGNF